MKPTPIEVAPSDVRPNPWNPNRMSPEMFQKEVRSIQRHGFVDPISVRETDTGFEIVDGEHRWRAAQELGLAAIPAMNLGPLTNQDAQRLTILFNELKGDPEPLLLASLLQDLATTSTAIELAQDLPMQVAEIDSLIKAASFSWDSVYAASAEAGRVEAESQFTGAEQKRFVLGGVQGHVPVHLTNRLLAEYAASAEAIQSNTVELVLTDLLDRLVHSPPRNIVPKVEPPPKKVRKKKVPA